MKGVEWLINVKKSVIFELKLTIIILVSRKCFYLREHSLVGKTDQSVAIIILVWKTCCYLREHSLVGKTDQSVAIIILVWRKCCYLREHSLVGKTDQSVATVSLWYYDRSVWEICGTKNQAFKHLIGLTVKYFRTCNLHKNKMVGYLL